MTGKYSDVKAKLESDIVIVRYGELALKSSGVRNWYEKILMKNIAAMLESREIPYSQIRREWGRIFIETTGSRTVAEATADVFGVVSTSPAVTAEPGLEKAASVCAGLAQALSGKVNRLLSEPGEVATILSLQQKSVKPVEMLSGILWKKQEFIRELT